MFRISKSARWYFPAVALGFVLALLGVLQYRANRQLRDVLQQEMLTDAQTSLMIARTNLLRGLHDYAVARANLRWAEGLRPWE